MAVGMWFYLDAYNTLLEQAGFHEIDTRNISGSVAVYQQHVESRPKPCDITECAPLGKCVGTIVTIALYRRIVV